MRSLASVISVGAVTPVGLSAKQVAFSHRAAVAAMREAPLVDAEGKTITMCFLPTIDPELTGKDRAMAMAMRAFAEAIHGLGRGANALRATLALAMDEHFGEAPEVGDPPAVAIANELFAAARSKLGEVSLVTSLRGPAGPGALLPQALESLATGAIDIVVLGGVHTDYDPRRIASLLAADRIFRPDNLDAMIPGEAAAFVVLSRSDIARRLRVPETAAICTVATGHERARPDNDESAFKATGLTAAFRAALAPLAPEGLRAGWILTDLTFETFRHYELSAATTRTQRFFCEPQQVESPAQRMGNLGAAAMPLHLVLASEAHLRGFAPHGLALSIAGSDGGDRAAMLVSSA